MDVQSPGTRTGVSTVEPVSWRRLNTPQGNGRGGGTEKHSSGLRPKPERRAMVMEQDIVKFWLYLLMKTFLN